MSKKRKLQIVVLIFHYCVEAEIITLEPCALNAEFQQFYYTPDLIKISLLCRYH
jgi:hypothetical protein